MKLIKGILLWLALGVGTLFGLAKLVDEGFARYFSVPILMAFAAIGLIFGFRATLRARKEKRRKKQAVREVDQSRDQRTIWANEVKKRALELSGVCNKNNQIASGNLLFTAEYEAGDYLEEIVTELMMTAELQSRVLAAVQEMKEENGAL